MSESSAERIARLERSNAVLTVLVAGLLVLLGGLSIVGWQWAEHQRVETEARRREAVAALERARRVEGGQSQLGSSTSTSREPEIPPDETDGVGELSGSNEAFNLLPVGAASELLGEATGVQLHELAADAGRSLDLRP